jgi:hypothetical protein
MGKREKHTKWWGLGVLKEFSLNYVWSYIFVLGLSYLLMLLLFKCFDTVIQA